MAELRAADAPNEFEMARRMLLRRLAELNDRMSAAEPGTDDFLTAYNDFTRLRAMYRHVRDNWAVPEAVWQAVPSLQPLPEMRGSPDRASIRSVMTRFLRNRR